MAQHSPKQSLFNHLYTIIAITGVVLTLTGLGLDFIPGSSPGISFPQLMMILSGVALLIIGLIFRKASIRQHIAKDLFKNLLISCIVILIMLIVLEIGLVLANVKTRYPVEIPETFLEAVPWWTCDEAGCHYDYEHMQIACENKEVSGRRCMVNQQGFHDSQNFVASDEHAEELRILMLGDSFTFGGTADIGHSFVETIETNLPSAIVWNTAIPGAGTNQALASLQAFAPILNPQIAVLGFYMNDFDDNMFPFDSYFMGVNEDNYPLAIRQYKIDVTGEVIKLDRQSDFYYRYHQVDPPASELQRLIGTTRLGSLLLNTIDSVSQILSKADGKVVNKQAEVTEQYLRELRDYSQENEIALIVLLIPGRSDVDTQGTLFQQAIRLLDELEIPYLNPIDMLSATVDYAPEPDIHWSTEGHQKIGVLLTECFKQFQINDTLPDCESLILP